MRINFKIFVSFLSFMLFFSCNKKEDIVITEYKDLDILYKTKISITKSDRHIVDAFAKKLLSSNKQILLKADYNTEQISKLRDKLSFSIIQGEIYSMIAKLAEDLHKVDGNIKAEFYNEQNIISSLLYADSAKINNRYNNMIAEGNVVIYSPETDLMLLGDKVLWNNNAKRIMSEDNVTIIKITDDSQCIQKSHGFESDMNLSNYIFYDIKGKINEDCF